MKYVILLIYFSFLRLHAQNASSIIPVQKNKIGTVGQTDLIDIVKSIIHINPKGVRTEKEKTVYFSILPVSSTAPGGNGRAFVTSTTAGIYLGPPDSTNLSSITFTPYWNFGSRFGLPMRDAFWLRNNSWTIQGDMRILRYPQYTWGLGNGQPSDRKIMVDYNYYRFYQSVLKKIYEYLFAGFGYDLDYHSAIHADDRSVDLGQFTHYNYGINGSSVSSGLTLNAIYDTRNNSINPYPGAYCNIIYRINPTFLGSNNTWNSLYIDIRKYISLNPDNQRQQNKLAFWTYLWSSFNGKAPYLDLPSIGWDPYNRSGRGINQNRYRGQTLFYFESEYRRDITKNGLFGFVVFTNINSVSGSGNLFKSWNPAAGCGLRIKFNKGSGTNIGIDYGFSKGYQTVMLSLGEAF